MSSRKTDNCHLLLSAVIQNKVKTFRSVITGIYIYIYRQTDRNRDYTPHVFSHFGVRERETDRQTDTETTRDMFSVISA